MHQYLLKLINGGNCTLKKWEPKNLQSTVTVLNKTNGIATHKSICSSDDKSIKSILINFCETIKSFI